MGKREREMQKERHVFFTACISNLFMYYLITSFREQKFWKEAYPVREDCLAILDKNLLAESIQDSISIGL